MSRKLRMDDRFEVFWKFRRKLRRLRISWLKYLLDIGCSIELFVRFENKGGDVKEESWKIFSRKLPR